MLQDIRGNARARVVRTQVQPYTKAPRAKSRGTGWGVVGRAAVNVNVNANNELANPLLALIFTFTFPGAATPPPPPTQLLAEVRSLQRPHRLDSESHLRRSCAG